MRWPVNRCAAVAVLVCALSGCPPEAKKPAPPASPAPEAAAPPAAPSGPQCSGKFSDGTSISVSSPTYLQDVPGDQLFCDFHTFAWNQFIWLIQMQSDPNDGNQVTPLFLHLAPWYNVLQGNGSPQPGAYPGGSTALSAAGLDQGQAGDDDQLVDVDGGTVLYDIRFNQPMYNAIAGSDADAGTPPLYTQALYTKACAAGTSGTCANPLWLPPTTVAPGGQPPTPGSMEVKTAWRDFGQPASCPASTFYCNGRFGLVGMHVVQKTQTHGEWIWMSFEHADNDPDCYPGGDEPIAARGPTGGAWSFFNPATAGASVMSSHICEVTSSSGTPQCNGNPNPSGDGKTYVQVNICRTDQLPAGGASPANCAVVPDGPPQQDSNSPGNVACLNATLRPQLSGVWKNYKMIGSLWIRGTTGPEQAFQVQIFQSPPSSGSVKFGQPVGFVHMANTTMETWLQWGSTGYDPFGPSASNSFQAGCFLCHNQPTNAFADDLSHFPDKLPTAKLAALKKSLTAATSDKPHVSFRSLFNAKRTPVTAPKRMNKKP